MVSKEVIGKVLSKAAEVASHSWEFGTVAEAFLEWNNADASVWNNPFPGGQVPTLNVDSTPALSYIEPHINLTGGPTLVGASGAAGDPAALGVSAVMIGKSDGQYFDAATRQKDHLINDVPRWSNGAISHRENVAELWADFTYMAPPFLAYYAVASNDVSLLKEAANQCKLYSEVLGTQDGPWQHIVGPESADPGLWSTGNAWAVGGMSRVLATMQKSGFNDQTKDEQGTLTELIKKIIDGAIKLDAENSDDSGLLRNYLNDASWFGEISGTSLIAATALRMAKLDPNTFGKQYTDWAVKKMDAVDSKINESDGVVAPAVDPLDWHSRTPFTSGSPEGQAFVVLLHAAYEDWKGGQ